MTPPDRTATTLALLTHRPIAPLLALAFVTRTTVAILPVTLLLAIAENYGYARAGLVTGGHTLLLALLVPLRGRLLDRYRHRHALPLMGATTATLTTAAAVSVTFRWPWWTTLLLVISASASGPPLNAALRASWRRLVPHPHHLKAVHTADSVLEEAGFVAAPLTAGTVVVLLGPVPAYQVTAAGYLAVLVGYLTVARRLGLTAPPPAPAPTATGPHRRQRWLGPLARPGILSIMVPLLIMGCLFGGTSVYVPAYSQHQHAAALIGPLLAALSAGGVAGGVLYAVLPTQRLPLWTTYRLLTAGFALPGCFLLFAHSPWLLAALLLASGLFVTPLFITAFLLVDATATDDTRIEANTWVGASTDVANGVVAPVVGALTADHHFRTALAVLSGCAALGILTSVALPTPTPAAPDRDEPGRARSKAPTRKAGA